MSSRSYRAVRISEEERRRLAAERKRRLEAQEKRRREEQRRLRRELYDRKFSVLNKIDSSGLDLGRAWKKPKKASPAPAPSSAGKTASESSSSLNQEVRTLQTLLKDIPEEIETMIPSRLTAIRKTLEIVARERPGRQEVHTVSLELRRRELEGLIRNPRKLMDLWEETRKEQDALIRRLELSRQTGLASAEKDRIDDFLERLNTLAALRDVDRMHAGTREIAPRVDRFLARLDEDQGKIQEREYVDRSIKEVLIQMGYTPVNEASTPSPLEDGVEHYLTPGGQAIGIELDETGRLATEFFLVRRNGTRPPDQEALAQCLASCRDLEELGRRLAHSKGINLTLEGEVPADRAGYPELELSTSRTDPAAARGNKGVDRGIREDLTFDVDAEERFESES